jgi:hypothetical protein
VADLSHLSRTREYFPKSLPADSACLLLTDASVEDEGVAQGDDDEGLNVTDGEHVDVRLGWPVVIVSPA